LQSLTPKKTFADSMRQLFEKKITNETEYGRLFGL
jgi:hypothetical protein